MPGVDSQVRVCQGLESKGRRFIFLDQSAVDFCQLLKARPPPPHLHLLSQVQQVKGHLLAEKVVTHLEGITHFILLWLLILSYTQSYNER